MPSPAFTIRPSAWWLDTRARTRSEVRGRLLTVETHDDRTLFFDLLPVFFTTEAGFKVKVKLFTVPGQVIHNATRRIVLQNADAVAFIADSRRSAGKDNNAYWKNLQENMRENGLDPAHVPVRRRAFYTRAHDHAGDRQPFTLWFSTSMSPGLL